MRRRQVLGKKTQESEKAKEAQIVLKAVHDDRCPTCGRKKARKK